MERTQAHLVPAVAAAALAAEAEPMHKRAEGAACWRVVRWASFSHAAEGVINMGGLLAACSLVLSRKGEQCFKRVGGRRVGGGSRGGGGGGGCGRRRGWGGIGSGGGGRCRDEADGRGGWCRCVCTTARRWLTPHAADELSKKGVHTLALVKHTSELRMHHAYGLRRSRDGARRRFSGGGRRATAAASSVVPSNLLKRIHRPDRRPRRAHIRQQLLDRRVAQAARRTHHPLEGVDVRWAEKEGEVGEDWLGFLAFCESLRLTHAARHAGRLERRVHEGELLAGASKDGDVAPA